MAERAAGPAAGRTEDPRLLRGEGRYGDDTVPAGALCAVFLRAPHAHAAILSIDTGAARAMPGVAAVLTAADMAGLGNVEPNMTRPGPGGRAMFVPPRPPLTGDVARYVGDPVALVLARTLDQAEDAAEAVLVDYEARPAVTDTRAAVAPGAPEVWPEAPGNIIYEHHAGDAEAVDKALAGAAHVTEVTVPITRTTAAPMEPRTALAEYDGRRFRFTAGMQAPWATRTILARILGVAPGDMDVHVPDVGGSFGMKGQTFPEYAALLQAARLTGRPVYWRATRSEAMLSDDQGRDMVLSARLGLDAEGRILALDIDGLAAVGAYIATRGTLTQPDNLAGACGPYRVPAAHARLRGVHSHTPSISPYRGAGRPEASLLIERAMDEAARQTGRDPVDFRRLNLLTPDELPRTTPLGFTYDSGDFPAVLERAEALGDRAGFAARRADSDGRGRLRGLGCAFIIARSAGGGFEAARMTLGAGGVTLACGAISNGQGHATVFPALAAERLGLAPGEVAWDWGRTELFEKAVGSFGSRTAGIAGPAVVQAAEKLVEVLTPEAARLMNAAPEELRYAAGAFTAGAARLTLSELGRRLSEPVSAEVLFTPEGATFPNSAHFCEVEIDPETGRVTVPRYAVVEDVGTVLNPVIVKGQIHGGIAQGLAQVMAEQVAFDPDTGQPLTGSFMDFAVPRATDLPFYDVAALPVPTRLNPLGAKGAGEGGTIGALPAFQNALADALAPLGITEIPMPATPSALWTAISAATGEGGR